MYINSMHNNNNNNNNININNNNKKSGPVQAFLKIFLQASLFVASVHDYCIDILIKETTLNRLLLFHKIYVIINIIDLGLYIQLVLHC